MGSFARICSGVLALLFAGRTVNAADLLKFVDLPVSEGAIGGGAFSPDSSRLAIVRSAVLPGGTSRRVVLHIIDLGTQKELARSDEETSHSVSETFFLAYSRDGRSLLIAGRGSDTLLIVDTVSLQTVKVIALHPQESSRVSLGPRRWYFRGVMGLAVSSRGNVFAVLTHDEKGDNEVFLGSFSSLQILHNWSLGRGRISGQLGETSLSMRDDGSEILVSLLPDSNRLPKGFDNVRLYNSASGKVVNSIRTDGLVGQLVLFGDEHFLASRIDTFGQFSKRRICIENWTLSSRTLERLYCDSGRSVSAGAVSIATERVVGFAATIHKSIEGLVYAAPGRVDMWDMKSGHLVASSAEIPGPVCALQVSANGKWVLTARMLLLQFHSDP